MTAAIAGNRQAFCGISTPKCRRLHDETIAKIQEDFLKAFQSDQSAIDTNRFHDLIDRAAANSIPVTNRDELIRCGIVSVIRRLSPARCDLRPWPCRLASNRYWHATLAEAERLVARHWPQTERLAYSLLDHGALSGDEIEVLLMVPSQLARTTNHAHIVLPK